MVELAVRKPHHIMSRSTKQDYPRTQDSRNRVFFDDKARAKLDGQEDEFFGFWSYPDPIDALMDISEEMVKQWGSEAFEAEQEFYENRDSEI